MSRLKYLKYDYCLYRIFFSFFFLRYRGGRGERATENPITREVPFRWESEGEGESKLNYVRKDISVNFRTARVGGRCCGRAADMELISER